MVGLHALQSGDKDSAAGQVIGLLLGGDGALDGAAGPEAVEHGAPGVLGVGAEVGGTVLADDETGRLAGELEVHNAVGVDSGLDVVCVALFVESDGQVIGAEGVHVLVKHEVVQGIGVPDVRAIALEVEDLRVEVRGGMDTAIVQKSHVSAARENTPLLGHRYRVPSEECSRNVAVNDLDEDQIAAVGYDVEGSSLHIGILVGLPSQILLGQNGVGSLGGLLGDGLDGLGAIDGFLRAHGRGQAVDLVLATIAHIMEERSVRRLKPVHDDLQGWTGVEK